MSNWGRRIRGALGMGLAWGIAGGFAGGVLVRVTGIKTDLPLPLLFFGLGFICGIIFSAILVAIARRRQFDSLSIPRFAAWGASGGLLLSAIFAVGAALRGDSVLN